MRLRTKRLILRDITMKDAKDLSSAINNIDISRWLLVIPHPYTMKDAKQLINKLRDDSKKKPRSNYSFGIELAGKHGIIGAVGMSRVNIFQGTATIMYWLGQKYWRQGIMQEAVTKVIDYAFYTLKLRRIDVSAFVGNIGSNQLIKKLGFSYEGTRKERCRSKADGKIHDEFIYGLLRRDWKKR
ncbi:MAG: GNAT family protein [Candidatus Aenigmatarchaeota archaeon]